MRIAVEVMTGRKPRDTVELALYMDKLLKDTTRADIDLKRLESICGNLAKRVAELHEDVKDTAVKNTRTRALRDAKKKDKGALAFQVGDLVMIAAQDNAANIKKKAKPMVNWQGPYEVVRAVSTSEFDV